MTKPARLSCLVVAHNEETDLPDCLASLRFADEILVVLDRCTDRSKEIARAADATLLEGAWPVQGDRRNDGIKACSGDWILEVDADERVPTELGREVRRTIEASAFDYHRVPVDNYVGKRLVRDGWGASFGRRSHPGLFRKDVKTWRPRSSHPALNFKSGAKEGPPLAMPIAHYGFDGISDLIGRLNRYSDRHAADLRDAGDIGTALNNYRRVVSRFWKCFVSRKGYREGGIGFVIAVCAALYPILSYLKAKYDTPPDA